MLAEPEWWLGEPPRIQRPGASEGFYVFVGDSIQDVVVFLGFRDTNAPAGIRNEGTGFFLFHDDCCYLVTVRHVAEKFENSPFVIRANRHKGPAELLDVDNVAWYFPREEQIDLAVAAITVFAEVGRGPLHFPSSRALDNAKLKSLRVGIGDECYTVGLFHFVAGHKRNLPLLYTGNIALIPPPDEKIPVGNSKGGADLVEAYLIESGAINGASGSPVFVRSSLTVRNLPVGDSSIVALHQIYLLGVFQAAWFLPPDEPLRQGVRAKTSDIVPVGLGVVVPAQKLMDLLERDDVKNDRKQKPTNAARMTNLSAVAVDDEEDGLPSTELHPKGRERFNSLLTAAGRKRE
jgi:Trypsin-like peptidase domain